jgi:hypothetical protein
MFDMTDCTQNRDPLKLVREGTNQEQRHAPALDPAYAPVYDRKPAHGMVFAKVYAAFLKYYNSKNVAEGDWKSFFSDDVSVRLAVAAVQDIADYQSAIKGYFVFLNNRDNKSDEAGLKDHLGYLFACAATLAKQLDVLKEELPVDIALKHALQNRIRSQLAPAFNKLILYYRDGLNPDPPSPPDAPYHNDVKPTFDIMGETWTFRDIKIKGLSKDWITADDATRWTDYLAHLHDLQLYPPTQIYGSGDNIFKRINHIATHHLFKSGFDLFLKAYAHTVNEANRALEETLSKWDRHEPHYALFLSFLKLFEYAREEMNTLTGHHLDFYYREILRLKEKAAEPGRAHLLAELAKQATTHRFKSGELFKAGKDDRGKAVFFANDREVVVNRAKVTSLKTVYRYSDEEEAVIEPFGEQLGRLYASNVAKSEDGMGAELTSVDQSWHPFYIKKYRDGTLERINMPEAEVGFAIASHYLWMAEGERTVTVKFQLKSPPGSAIDLPDDVNILFTGEKGWLEKTASRFYTINSTAENTLTLEAKLSGSDPPIVPYSKKTHRYNFDTNLPVLLVKLKHQKERKFVYSSFEDLEFDIINLVVDVKRLKSLAVSNFFGPIDTSKPFLPFGAIPVERSSMIVGSKEVFQKKLDSFTLISSWQDRGTPYPAGTSTDITATWLNGGQWDENENTEKISSFFSEPIVFKNYATTIVDEPDISKNEFFSTNSRNGYVRLSLDSGFGQAEYQAALRAYLIAESQNPGSGTNPTPEPSIPVIESISADYKATQVINLDSALPDVFADRKARFYHVAPFGQAEQHPYLKTNELNSKIEVPDSTIYILPQMKHLNVYDSKLPEKEPVKHEAEFYVGINDLIPPQNLSLLFQVADGTADPLADKPDPHIHWSYLRDNEWIPFAENDIADRTDDLLNSGIISFAIPRDASDNNTLLPESMHWIRGAVASQSGAVCRLLTVAAQALEVTFTDRGNDPMFPAKVLPPDTISKLDQPNAAVKKIRQPFATFGGRGKEAPKAFYTRISERLRHKDRAIALWGYERLVLEAFPQIFKVRCLNHTHYEPSQNGAGIYRELAPGHVTVITIPDQQFHLQRDPLRPYTSLGLLEEIEAFLDKRLSCFIKLHVKNPEFEEVWVEFNVRLQDGLDENFYEKKLQEDITRFLSPWAFPGGGSPSFGGKVYKSVLINFVEEQPCVDYVTDFQLWHKFDDSEGMQKDEVEGSKAVSILVSVPANKHKVTAIKPAGEEKPGEKCPCEA